MQQNKKTKEIIENKLGYEISEEEFKRMKKLIKGHRKLLEAIGRL